MKNSINLIIGEQKKYLIYEKLRKKINSFTIIVLSVFAFFVLILFLALSITKNKFSVEKEKVASLEKIIKAYPKIEWYMITISDRISKIEEINKTRNQYAKTLNNISGIFVPGFSLKKMEVKNKIITIQGVCEDLQSITNFNARVEEIIKDNKVSKLIIPSVSRKSDGGYDVTLAIAI